MDTAHGFHVEMAESIQVSIVMMAGKEDAETIANQLMLATTAPMGHSLLQAYVHSHLKEQVPNKQMFK